MGERQWSNNYMVGLVLKLFWDYHQKKFFEFLIEGGLSLYLLLLLFPNCFSNHPWIPAHHSGVSVLVVIWTLHCIFKLIPDGRTSYVRKPLKMLLFTNILILLRLFFLPPSIYSVQLRVEASKEALEKKYLFQIGPDEGTLLPSKFL